MDMRHLLVLAIMMSSIAYADVLSPDYHTVDHKLYIDNIDEYEEYQFFIYPVEMAPGTISQGMRLLDFSEIPMFYYMVSPHLYAVEKIDMENRTPEEYFPLALKSKEPLNVTTALPNTDPTTRIETHYTVSMVGEELVLTKVSEEQMVDEEIEDADGAEQDQVGDIIVDDGVEEECEECPEPPPERGLDYYLLVAGLGIGLIVGYLAGKRL